MEWLKAVYIGATIFGGSITIADLIGVFSNLGGQGDSDADGDSVGDDVDFDAAADSADADADGDGDGDGESDSDDDADAGEDHGSIVGHDRRQKRNPALTILTAARTLVYFAVGFGPVGWFATTQYPSMLTTLAWSIPMGAFVAIGSRALRSLMRKDLSSTITKTDLIMEKGVVTVTIGPGAVGKVRISAGGVYVDRFAKSEDTKLSFPTGTVIRVVNVDDEYVYIEKESD